MSAEQIYLISPVSSVSISIIVWRQGKRNVSAAPEVPDMLRLGNSYINAFFALIVTFITRLEFTSTFLTERGAGRGFGLQISRSSL